MINQLKTLALLVLITALFVTIGDLIDGRNGALIALLIAIILNFSAYWFSSQIILRMYNAQEIYPQNAPEIYAIASSMAHNARIPLPKMYVINQEQPNAFATGRNHNNSAIALTVGLIKILDQNELGTVIAHEMSHIRHHDTLISTITATICTAISSLALIFIFNSSRDENNHHNFISEVLIAIFAPIAASIIQLSISRSREYLADEEAAYISRNPMALASALVKIEKHVLRTNMPSAINHPPTAQMMIINPLSNTNLNNLFATHPSTTERVESLHLIAEQIGQI